MTKFKYHVDWDGSSTFASTDEVTADVWVDAVASVDQGVDSDRIFYPPMVGEATFSLLSDLANNNKYHPVSSTQLTIKPGLDVRIRSAVAGTTYNVFRGYVDDAQVVTNPENESVRFVVYDPLSLAVERTINTAAYQGITTGAAVGIVLDTIGWPAGRRKLDTGGTTMPVWTVENQDAWSALKFLVEIEGPQARLFVDGDGDIVFHDRHRPFTQDSAKTVQATFRNSSTEPNFLTPLRLNNGWRDIVNKAEFSVTPVTKEAETVVWTYPEGRGVEIPSDTTVNVYAVAPSSAPFASVIAPVEDTDYTIVGSTFTAPTINVESGSVIQITFTGSTAGNSKAVDLQLRGQPYEQQDDLIVIDESTASQDAFNRVSIASFNAGAAMDSNTATDLAAAIVADGEDPRAEMVFTVSNLNDTRAAAQWDREIGDRIRVVDTRSGIDQEAWLVRRRTDIQDGGKTVFTTYTARAVSTGLVGSTEIFILDSTDQGVLGTNKLGY